MENSTLFFNPYIKKRNENKVVKLEMKNKNKRLKEYKVNKKRKLTEIKFWKGLSQKYKVEKSMPKINQKWLDKLHHN